MEELLSIRLVKLEKLENAFPLILTTVLQVKISTVPLVLPPTLTNWPRQACQSLSV